MRDHSRDLINFITKKSPKDLINLGLWLTITARTIRHRSQNSNTPEAKFLWAWELADAKVWELKPTEKPATKEKEAEI